MSLKASLSWLPGLKPRDRSVALLLIVQRAMRSSAPSEPAKASAVFWAATIGPWAMLAASSISTSTSSGRGAASILGWSFSAASSGPPLSAW